MSFESYAHYSKRIEADRRRIARRRFFRDNRQAILAWTLLALVVGAHLVHNSDCYLQLVGP